MAEQLKDVSHDYIRYANCWEDADLLLEALEPKAGDRILSIASAGDNSFSLLCGNPDLVVAVDINPVQLNLVALKKAAFQHLDYHDFLAFLGFTAHANRMELFNRLKEGLSPSALKFWKQRSSEIEAGIIHAGKFEKYFQLFRKRMLPLLHSKARISALFVKKEAGAQKEFFEKQWFNWRWKMAFKIFFSRWSMGRLGRDPKFLNEVKVSVSTFILEQAKKHLSSVYCQENYFLHYILKGDFGSKLPHYARAENFQIIKSNLDRLIIFQGLAEDAFKEYQGFNKFNLSNIFEYMELDLFDEVSRNILNNSDPKSRFAYWNLMVPRKMHHQHKALMADAKYGICLERDKGFFYRDFNLSIRVDG